MSRRIALVVTALVAMLLALAVVPLGLALTANVRASFRFAAQSDAGRVSAQAEEYLADHHEPDTMNAALQAAAADGDCAAVYGPGGAAVAATPCAAASSASARALLPDVRAGQGDVIGQSGSWLQIAVAVGDEDKLSGAVVFARNTDPLDDRITVLWAWLGGSGAAVLVLGVLLAFRVARWVTRPLDSLGATAARLGEGSLDARAPDRRGPQEVRTLASVFNRMAERTETLVHGHEAWVADVSHQLRTPLAALRLRLDVLADEAEGEMAAELSGVQDEIGRFSRLVDGLLAVARAEAAVPRPEPVDTAAVAAERIAAWEPVARERRVELRADCAASAVARLGPGDLEQILDNLLANALEAVADGGGVRVAAAAAYGRVTVSVIDDGPGMSDAVKTTAFHRFGRSGSRGTGLGLAIVQRLAAANGGSAVLRDTPGGGLTVVVDFPSAR
jgi:signal transduction histidine kinase